MIGIEGAELLGVKVFELLLGPIEGVDIALRPIRSTCFPIGFNEFNEAHRDGRLIELTDERCTSLCEAGESIDLEGLVVIVGRLKELIVETLQPWRGDGRRKLGAMILCSGLGIEL